MEQKSQSKFLPWPGFQLQTSHLAVQHATGRPSCTPSINNQWENYRLFITLLLAVNLIMWDLSYQILHL